MGVRRVGSGGRAARRRGESLCGQVWITSLEAELLGAAALSYILPCTVSQVC